MALLQELNAEGLTVLLVTHEPDIAAFAGRLIVVKDGRIRSDENACPSPPNKRSPSGATGEEAFT